MVNHASLGARTIALCAALALTAGCLPRSGPTRGDIFSGSVQRQGDAFVVEVNSRVTRATAVTEALGFSEHFTQAGLSSADTIRAGDLITLTVYENVDDGLLAGGGGGGRAAQISELQVDGAGNIFVPYAGRVQAAGKTPDQLREALTRSLDEQTPDPQVVVRREAGDGSTVSVAGAVTAQGVYPIERPNRTLSGMLAVAGGVAVEPDIARITLVRGENRGTIWFQDLYDNPSLDVPLRAGDRILVEEDSRAFTALGATGQQARMDFESQTISAIEAIAMVGGLNPNLADPTGVFVLRNEAEPIARNVLGRGDLTGAQRMIYVLDLTAPTGMFEARDFLIRDGDTVLVTEAPFAQWSKVLGVVTGTLSTAGAITNLANANN